MSEKRMAVKKGIGVLLAALVVALNYTPWVQNFFQLPDKLSIAEGQSLQLKLGIPMPVETSDVSVLSIGGTSLGGSMVNLDPVSCGSTELNLKLFGVVPVKKIDVEVVSQKILVPGGQCVGVSLYTAGTLVVGRSDIVDTDGNVHNPARDADLRPGDVILKVNGEAVEDSLQLTDLVSKYGKEGSMELLVQREGKEMTIKITPIREQQDGQLRLGLWVRDSTIGVGTMTFYDPSNNSFGALGHAIMDVDTGTLLSVKEGEIVESKVVDVQQGTAGSPGELKGLFMGSSQKIGSISENTPFGIYGSCYNPVSNSLYPQGLPVSSQAAVKVGPAKILATVDDSGVQSFDCRITHITRQAEPAIKSMVIEITDPVLLAKTGGIVQGMSGSPIIQDGHIVGAVTHVFVNDPTKGHGLFIEWMLEQSEALK